MIQQSSKFGAKALRPELPASTRGLPASTRGLPASTRGLPAAVLDKGPLQLLETSNLVLS
jgi:hypothetical protein